MRYLTDLSKNSLSLSEILKSLELEPSLSSEDSKIAKKIINELSTRGTVPFSWSPQEASFISTQPKEKWLKYLIYRYKFKIYPKNHIVSDFPTYVLIEPVSSCNLRCVMCFQLDKTFTKKPFMGIMPLNFFKRIIDEVVEGGTCAVTMASRGEPTLHPKLPEMIEYASGKFFDLKINTNATKLTENLSHAILSSDVNEMVFSVDAEEKDLYEKIRVRGNFKQVLANIEKFHEIRAKHYPNSKLSTRVSGVEFLPDQDENRFKQFWSKIVDNVVLVGIENRWDTYNNEIDINMVHPCEYLWERFYVWFDGICNPCDVDYKSSLSPGNLHDNSIKEIWKGEALNQLREAHVNGKRGNYNPCDRCGV
jgi:MoaA/NifB/PqqE/SkfB family radical SAM enzyme